MAVTGRWKIWLLLVIVVIALLIAVPALGGRMLNQRHIASSRIMLNERPETVWIAISDFASNPSWRHEVESEERLEDRSGHQVWREHYRSGQTIAFETIDSCAPRRLVRKIVDERAFSGTWDYELAPHNGGTELRITEMGEVYNPIFRFISQYLMGHYTTMNNYEKALAAHFGEAAQIQNLHEIRIEIRVVSGAATAQPCSSSMTMAMR